MATYFFDTITAAQAASYNGPTDYLVFRHVTAASQIRVFDNPVTGKVELTDLANGGLVAFGDGIRSEDELLIEGGRRLTFSVSGGIFDPNPPPPPPPPPGLAVTGTSGDDGLTGGDQADTLNGLAGADTLAGAGGADKLAGGAGNDLFVVTGSSPPAAGQMATIADWQAGDRIDFHGPAATQANYAEQSDPSSFATALSTANFWMSAHAANYVASVVGSDVVIFADVNNDHVADTAVLLAGRSLADVDVSAIGTFASTQSPSSPGLPFDPYETPITPTSGNDNLVARGGHLDLNGGAGADTMTGASEPDKLWGGEGADSISGGTDFDDINGNQGNDVIRGGLGDDWVVGGKDDDQQWGDAGADVVWGNLGNDTLDGGAGADQVRGGQGDDVMTGGDGDDYVSGDLGSDTETGGAGADRFHTWGATGIDRVLDFHQAEGDRVMLDPGTVYTVVQVGADTVISMDGGAQMTLVGVQLSMLTEGWIFSSWT